MRVAYEEIVPPGSLQRVLDYLTVNPQIDVTPMSKRQFRGDSTLDRFSNPTGTRLGTPLAQWLARGIAAIGATRAVQRLTNY
jgi:hypothetical protein